MTSFQGFLRFGFGAAVAFSLLSGPVRAEDVREGAGERPVLVELFLSQACPMCPKAAALFPDIAARDDVVALSWHIDYWNMTSSPDGSWADPYSHAAFTKRQWTGEPTTMRRSSTRRHPLTSIRRTTTPHSAYASARRRSRVLAYLGTMWI